MPRISRISPMQGTDIDAVAALEASVATFPWSHGHFSDSLKAGYAGWVHRDPDGRLVGYYILMQAVDEIHLLNIGVDRPLQRRGRGSALLRHALAEAWLVGGRSIILEVRPSNAGAVSLYRRFGFEEIGRRRGYYPADGGREDALVMRRALTRHDLDAVDALAEPTGQAVAGG